MKYKGTRKRRLEIIEVDSNDRQVEEEQVHGTAQTQSGLNEETSKRQRQPFTVNFAIKKPRGKARCIDVQRLGTIERIVVPSNRFGQPINAGGISFARFLGLVARNGVLCPLNYANWINMPNHYKIEQISYIKSKYHYDASLDNWTKKSLAAKWRGYKAHLKGKWFKPNLSEEWNCTHVPPDVAPQQWHFLVNHFFSPKGKKLSEIGLRSKAAQKANHTCGSLSFANKIDAMEVESGDRVGAITFFKVSRTTKGDEDKLIDEEAERIMEEANTIFKEFKEANPAASTDDLFFKEQEIMTNVRGKEVSGRVRGLGLGPTPTQLGLCARGSSHYRTEESNVMKKRVTELEGQVVFLRDILKKAGLLPSEESGSDVTYG